MNLSAERTSSAFYSYHKCRSLCHNFIRQQGTRLADNTREAFRPADHRWNKSNQATSHVSQNNFKPRRQQDLDDDKQPRYIHHVYVSEFFLAAKQDCQLCLMLLGQLRPEDNSALARPHVRLAQASSQRTIQSLILSTAGVGSVTGKGIYF